jgi:ParB family chromosome partitioning protein
MGKRNALGRGLDALLPASISEVLSGKEVFNITIANVRPNPDQPRKSFDEDSLNSLALSIKTNGVLQPILVHRIDDKYELIAGERRFRASKIAGLKKIPAIVMTECAPDVLMFFSLTENLQREDLNPIEEAEAYRYLIDKFSLTQDQIAERVGKSRSLVANTLRLLKLPKPVHEMILSGKITAGHAIALLAARDEERILRLAKLASSRGLSVERLEILARENKPSPRHRKSRRSSGKKSKLTPEIAALEDAMKSHLATKVKIDLYGERGSIIIDFYSDEDLKRIAEILAEG